MDQTPVSLLEKLRRRPDPESWGRFVQLYTPLLFLWAGRLGLQDEDAADVVQEVFLILLEKLPEFQYDPRQRFRGWLWTLTRNKCRDFWRRRAAQPRAASPDCLARMANPEVGEDPDEAEYRHYLVARALHLMQTEFSSNLWRACWEHVVAGRSAAEVAAELGIAEGTVYVAKSRVVSRLRQELDGLLD
jgi:RNA polymerase sigma-70 factor (ECF subfamily)